MILDLTHEELEALDGAIRRLAMESLREKIDAAIERTILLGGAEAPIQSAVNLKKRIREYLDDDSWTNYHSVVRGRDLLTEALTQMEVAGLC